MAAMITGELDVAKVPARTQIEELLRGFRHVAPENDGSLPLTRWVVLHETLNAVNLRTVNLVMVPGLMGTRLEDRDGENLWDDPGLSTLLFSMSGPNTRLKALDPEKTPARPKTTFSSAARKAISYHYAHHRPRFLHRDGIATAEELVRVLEGRGWASPLWDFYGDWLMDLDRSLAASSLEGDVFAFGYDWRRSNRVSGRDLQSFLIELHRLSGRSALVVTHSMGGFVTRSALMNHPGQTLPKEAVLGVVHTLQPANGTPLAAIRLMCGSDLDQPRLRKLGLGDDKPEKLDHSFMDGIAHGTLARIMGNKRYHTAFNFSVMPGPLELVPAADHHAPSGDVAKDARRGRRASGLLARFLGGRDVV
ncbi:MAG: hypothetical protein HC923_08810 [Myxococcales bacterium]|nr:hypothetical protein [Myxococcales bacterium]